MENIVIVNPTAGSGRTGKIWPQIELSLKKNIGSFRVKFTSGRGNATIITRQILDNGPARIVAIGGDGLLNEVLNGFFQDDILINSESCLSFVMTGTGCDFQRSLGFPNHWQSGLENLKNSETRKIDIGKVIYSSNDKKEKKRYFINIASFGLSGAVDQTIEKFGMLKYLGGKLLFLCSTIKTIFTYPNQSIRYSIDGNKWSEIRTRLGVLANGQFFGGGMNVAPEAELDDGFLDLLILKEVSLLNLLLHLPKIYRGTHLLSPEVFYLKVKSFDVTSVEKILLDIDGEASFFSQARFEILPKILNIKI